VKSDLLRCPEDPQLGIGEAGLGQQSENEIRAEPTVDHHPPSAEPAKQAKR
jgi:hypothetical protein